jgi:hypothetical protein
LILLYTLDCCDNSAGRHIHFARFLDDSLQHCADVALTFRKQSECVRMPVDARSVCQSILLGEDRRGTPRNEIWVNL